MVTSLMIETQKLKQLQSAYLALAREAIDRAKILLSVADENQFIYAALELRRAFEALVYENALRFTDELVGEDYSVWQPAQLLERLLEIDPVADATLEMKMQDPQTGEWLSLGHQRRIALPTLRKRYHALGNYLHAPSLTQMLHGRRQDLNSLLKLCSECMELIEEDLKATLRLGRMAIFGSVTIECRQCGAPIRRLLNALKTPQNKAPGTKKFIVAKCSKCPASYEICADGADGVMWREQRWTGNCPYPGCEGRHTKWAREVKDRMASTCPSCGKRAVFTQAYTFLPEDVLKELQK